MDQGLIEVLTQRHIDLDDPTIAPIFARREPTQVADLREEPVSELNEIVLRAGYRALMVAPLLRGEDIVGMLVVRRRTPGEFAFGTKRTSTGHDVCCSGVNSGVARPSINGGAQTGEQKWPFTKVLVAMARQSRLIRPRR